MTKVATEHEHLSIEAVQLINEIWDLIDLIYGHAHTHDELRQFISIGSSTMDEYHLRQVRLKLSEKWRSSKKETNDHKDERFD